MGVITVLFQLLRARSAGEFLSATLLLCKNFDQLMSTNVASEKPPDCGQKKATFLCSRSALYTFSLFFLALPVLLMTDYTFKVAVITFKLHLDGDATVRVGRCLSPGRPVNQTKITFEYHWTGFFWNCITPNLLSPSFFRDLGSGSSLSLCRLFYDEHWSKHRVITCLDWSPQVGPSLLWMFPAFPLF